LNLFENILWWIVIFALAINIFLIILKGFLRERRKVHSNGVLGFSWFLLLILSLLLFGWFIALCHLIGSLIFGVIIYPITFFIVKKFYKADIL